MSDGLDDGDRQALLGLLDVDYYAARYAARIGGTDPAEHFLTVGWREGLSPARTFDTGFYLAAHAEVAAAGFNPVLHYARYGRAEGRATQAPFPEALRALLAPAFDAAYYRAANPDVAATGIDPLYHFYVQGWREGRNPRADFDVGFYRRSNPDVERQGMNPFVHFLRYGRGEGRRSRAGTPLDHARAALRRHFDRDYYRAMNPDIRDTRIDPLQHFHERGWREGRNPNGSFDVAYYLRANPDVAEAGIDPLLHYCESGEAEGRATRRPFDAARRQIDEAVPPAQRSASLVSPHAAAAPLMPPDLEARMAALTVNRRVVVSIGHDHYRTSAGGVQNLISDEVDAFETEGFDYLHLSPAIPMPTLAPAGAPEAFRFLVDFNRIAVGVATAGALAGWLAGAERGGSAPRFVVHHLMGHDPASLLLLLAAARAPGPLVWAHDHFAACPSHALMRNDVAFCGGPPPQSPACGICCYGGERASHLDRMTLFFEAADPVLVAPSREALEGWMQVTRVRPSRTLVAPLATLCRTDPVAAAAQPGRAPLRIAHLGGRAFHKGWPVFEALAERFAADPRYVFYRLGRDAVDPPSAVVRSVEVSVGAGNRDAMVSAVAALRIDVVVSWSLWPETFNFTTFEALAGGAFVVARRQAGDAWRAVRTHAPDQGCALDDPPALFDLFESGELIERLTKANRRRATLILTRGSADLLESVRHDRRPASPEGCRAFAEVTP